MKTLFDGQCEMMELHAPKENANGAKAYARKQAINARDRQLLIRDYIQRCHEEAHEMAEAHYFSVGNPDKVPEFHEELIDTLSFVTSLAIICDVDAIDESYLKIMKVPQSTDEFLQEFNWYLFRVSRQLTCKAWKSKRQKVDVERLHHEVNQLWTITFLFASSFIPDVVQAYLNKKAIVETRHAEGY